MKIRILALSLSLLAGLVATATAQEKKPIVGFLKTPWADKVDRANPLPEYPRPQLVRKEWTSLNGPWSYAIRPRADDAPKQYDGQILVPYPVESILSGVRKQLLPEQRLWYKRTFTAPDLTGGKRLLLHFQAVDFEATVFVNNTMLGQHKGGYDAFSLDITENVKPGAENELVVAVWDPTDRSPNPHGKQVINAMTNPGGIMYTPCSGIWQTVWLEPVAAAHVRYIQAVPDVDAGVLKLTAATSRGEGEIEAVALADGKEIGRATGKAGEALSVPVPKAHVWSPDDPFLYDLKVTLKNDGKTADEVASYFGMRKIAIGKDESGFTRLLLNGKFVFQSGPLDQGFWPDGIYTAPTDEALKFDIETMKKLGFNMVRKHVKVEPQRWYYWCDKLGLLIWQDMPGSGTGHGGNREKEGVRVSDAAAEQFETELKHLVWQHQNAPSIIMWIVFNEGWGQYDTVRLTKWVKELDPSRLVSCASGWNDRNVGDIVDMHNYPGPGSPKAEPQRAAVLGEFGGLGLAVPEHTWVEKSWGYQGMASMKALTRRYIDLWRGVWRLKDEAGLCAAVYTQLTDCETECNGLLTYDRKIIKVALPASAEAAQGKFPPAPSYRTIVPTAEKEATTWRYTTTKPAENWANPDFDDSSWSEGPAGFGTKGTPGSVVRTEWKSADIWLRKTINLPAGKRNNPSLMLHHDEDVEVYINGVLAAKAGGYTTTYEPVDLTPAGAAALKPGANVIAVHCHQTMGGQYIDLGIVEEQTR